MMNKEDRELALHWLGNSKFDIITIAEHFGMAWDELANELRRA